MLGGKLRRNGGNVAAGALHSASRKHLSEQPDDSIHPNGTRTRLTPYAAMLCLGLKRFGLAGDLTDFRPTIGLDNDSIHTQ